jgi:hypothetical protein
MLTVRFNSSLVEHLSEIEDGIAGRLAVMEARLSDIDRRVTQIGERTQELLTRYPANQERGIKELKEQMEDLQTRVHALQFGRASRPPPVVEAIEVSHVRVATAGSSVLSSARTATPLL